MRRAHVFTIFFFSLISMFVNTSAIANDKLESLIKHQIKLTPCFVSGINSQVQCGLLSVAENRQKPMSEQNKIILNVVVLPKFKQESQKLPLIFLAGGPGQAATELAGMINRPLYKIRQEHDIVLVDQRGTGKSNGLRCLSSEEDALVFDDRQLDMKAEVAKCLEEFKDVHLPSYNTYDFIEDLEQVRESLGYKQVHLYGGSYGTRSGFAYLKRYPEAIKTATLDSNVPMQLVIGFFGKTSERAFNFLLQDCQIHMGCHAAFPNLKQDYLSLITKLKEQPITETIYHPVSGKTVDVVLTQTKVIEVIRSQLYHLSTRRRLPYLIHQASKGDIRGLVALMAQNDVNKDAVGSIYNGLLMNIVCNEDMHRATKDNFNQDDNNYFSGELGYSIFTDVCKHWPKWSAPDDFATPLETDVPILLFSGKYDPVTPPSYADLALTTLQNGKHVVIEHGSHVASLSMCTDEIKSFMQSGSFENVDFECAEEPIPNMFLLDMNQLK